MNVGRPDVLARPQVVAYLAELEAHLQGAAPDERADVVDGIRAHIAQSCSADASDAEVDTALARLGDPLVVAGEFADDVRAVAVGSTRGRRESPGLLESRGGAATVVLALAIGGLVVPVVGWIVGAVLLWLSRAWRWWDKLIGTLVVPGGFLGVFVGGLIAARSGYVSGTVMVTEAEAQYNPIIPETPWVPFALLALVQVASIVYLLWRHAQWRRSNAA